MQLHSFCSAFGIQRKEKKRKVYIHIYPHYVRLYVLGRNLRFAPHTPGRMMWFSLFWGNVRCTHFDWFTYICRSKQPTTQRNDEETITHACSPPWDGLRILGMLEKRWTNICIYRTATKGVRTVQWNLGWLSVQQVGRWSFWAWLHRVWATLLKAYQEDRKELYGWWSWIVRSTRRVRL